MFRTNIQKEVLQCKEGHWACKECWIGSLKIRGECMQCRLKITSLSELSRSRFLEDEWNRNLVYCPNRFINNNIFIVENNNQETTGPKASTSKKRKSKSKPNNNNSNNESTINGDYNGISSNGGNDLLILDNENGCKEIIKIRDLESHLSSCQFKFQKCINSKNGCKQMVRLNQIQQHTNICEFTLVSCEYCKKEGIIKSKLTNHHQLECPKIKVKCPQQCNSTELFEKSQLQHHIDTVCSNTIIPCKYSKDSEGGCNETFKRSEQLNHLSTFHTGNTETLIEKQSTQLKELIKSNLTNHQLIENLTDINLGNNQIIEKQSKELKELTDLNKKSNQIVEKQSKELKELVESNKKSNQLAEKQSTELKQLSESFKKSNLLIEKQSNEIKQLSESNRKNNQLIEKQSAELKELSKSIQTCIQLIEKQSLELLEMTKSNKSVYEQNAKLLLQESTNQTKYHDKWVIGDFSNLLKQCKLKDKISTAPFSFNGNIFALKIYPNNDREIGYVSIYLNLTNFVSPITVSILFTLSNHLNKIKNVAHHLEYKYTKSEGFGCLKFIKSSELTIENGWLSINDELIIDYTIDLKS